MKRIADIAGYDKDNNLILIVEVKTRERMTSQWASELLRNIWAHENMPKTKFFLLALPDKLYLWKDLSKDLSNAEYEKPIFELDSKPLLKDYYNNLHVKPEKLSHESLELIILTWLNELINSRKDMSKAKKELRRLFESNLIDSLKNGHLEAEAYI